MASSDHHYRILPHKGSVAHYVLWDGEEELGTLVLRNRRGSSATIHIAGETIIVRRRAGLRKHLSIERGAGNAGFAADSLSRGFLDLDGVGYRWLPQNARWTEWVWCAEDGREVVRISSHHRFVAYQAEVSGSGPALDRTQRELALLGWYLMLLNHQNFGMHLLTALDLKLWRDAAPVQ